MVDYTQIEGPVPGKTMKVTFDGTFVDGVVEWNIDPKADKVDITCAKSTNDVKYKSYLATLVDAPIQLKLAYRNLADAGQKKLWDGLGGAKKELRLYEDATHYCFCDAYVESFPLGAKVDDAQGNGITINLQIQDPDGVQFPTAFD